MSNVNWRKVDDELIVVIDYGEPYTIRNTNKDFESILGTLRGFSNDTERHTSNGLFLSDDEKESLINSLDEALRVRKWFAGSSIELRDGHIYYNNELIHNYLVDVILRMMDEGENVDPLTNFLSKMLTNPDNQVQEQLYKFLEYGKNAITPDGDFLAYKYVNSELKSCYYGGYVDGKFVSSFQYPHDIGTVVEMPRERCDRNPNNTCSKGLHVCSREYLGSTGTSGGTRLVVCKVNPRDVVAVPNDYNNTKMRTCRYEVVKEITPEEVRADILAQKPVMDVERKSSFIDNVWEAIDGDLAVDFSSGETYYYALVPDNVIEDFIRSDNWSTYFHENIQGRYQFSKL